jgi:hypothetical protein
MTARVWGWVAAACLVPGAVAPDALSDLLSDVPSDPLGSGSARLDSPREVAPPDASSLFAFELEPPMPHEASSATSNTTGTASAARGIGFMGL